MLNIPKDPRSPNSVHYDLVPFNKALKYVKMDFSKNDITGLSKSIKEEGMTDSVIHQAMFVSYVVLKIGIISLDEILGDFGLLHEMIHIKCFGERITPCAASIDNIIEMAENLEEKLSEIPLETMKPYFTLLGDNE